MTIAYRSAEGDAANHWLSPGHRRLGEDADDSFAGAMFEHE
jgi:hypothetical protein